MTEFIANQKNGKKLYRKVRKNYKRWKYGMLLSACILLYIISRIFWVLQNAEGAPAVETAIISAGVVLVPVIVLLLVYSAAISGGREVLMNRLQDKLILTENLLVMEYVPHSRETTEYDRIQYRMKYVSISEMTYERRHGRLRVSGPYEIRKYRNFAMGDMDGNVSRQNVEDGQFYLYAYYHDFEGFLQKIQKKTCKMVKEEG